MIKPRPEPTGLIPDEVKVLTLLRAVNYGKVVIHKEGGKIVFIEKTETIK